MTQTDRAILRATLKGVANSLIYSLILTVELGEIELAEDTLKELEFLVPHLRKQETLQDEGLRAQRVESLRRHGFLPKVNQ